MKYPIKQIILLAAAILLLTGTVSAAPWTQGFVNSYQTDNIQLWITDGGVDFLGWTTSRRDWSEDAFDSNYLAISGRQRNAGRLSFNVQFSDTADFTMEWAELLGGTVMGSGTAYYTGTSRSWNFTDEPASSLATPISGSVWLLLSGGFAVIGVRRKLTQSN